ncbi:MAG: phage shock protein operon transcriptional activator [Alphaproteobacteria bacterium]
MDHDTLQTPIGSAPAFLDMLAQVSRLAALDRPVLVIGERGSGKEVIAARLHFLSPRWDRPLVRVNCAALSETLLESELFGHEAGAFTGAARRRPGRFELADGGTLFLDEVANASGAVQEKLLRVIEYGTLERVGGNETLEVDVRIVAATNIDLPAAVGAGRFRADLLDRLAFDVVTVPPLRARSEDIVELAEHFAGAMAAELERGRFPGFSAEGIARLQAHDWPGNVRELKNVAERAVFHATALDRPIPVAVIDPFESPWRPAPPTRPATAAAPERTAGQTWPDGSAPLALIETVDRFEAALIANALAANRHNARATARFLGLSYDQLRNRMRKFGL